MARVTGTAELRALAAQLREIGDVGLRKELYAGINRPVKPLRAAVIQELAETMPHHGGYAGVVSGSTQVKVSTRTTGKGAGITVIGTAKGKAEKRDLAALEGGRLRHPLFGNRRHWYTTSVRPGFFTRPGNKFIGDIRDEIIDVIERIARKIEGA